MFFYRHTNRIIILRLFDHIFKNTLSQRNKHWDIKWRKLRAAKVIKMDLPDFDKIKREANMTPDEMKTYMKKEGIMPPRQYQERPINISSSGTIFEEYIPPEGDGLAFSLSGKGAKQKFTALEMKGKSMLQLRKIKTFEDDFDVKQFASKALDIYVEAVKLLENIPKNHDRLHELITEKAYPEMTWKLEKKSFRWKLLESLEAPRVVHIRTNPMLSKDNLYGQVTLRFFTKQTMALYDRFGRLCYGSEIIPQNCLDYVVFEKHLADEYGTWRVHGKVVPEWAPPTWPILRTMRIANNELELPDKSDKNEGLKNDNVNDKNEKNSTELINRNIGLNSSKQELVIT